MKKINLDDLNELDHYAHLHRDAAKEAKHVYLEIITNISKSIKANKSWALSLPASYNAYFSLLHSRLTKTIFVKNYLRNIDKKICFQTNDYLLAQCIKKLYPYVEIKTIPFLKHFFKIFFVFFKHFTISHIRLTIRWLSKQCPSKKDSHHQALLNAKTIIDSIIFSGNGPGNVQNGTFDDRLYKNEIHKIAQKYNKKIIYVVNYYGIHNFWTYFKKARKVTPKVILIDDYLKANDYICSILGCYNRIIEALKIPHTLYESKDISLFIKNELIVNAFNYNSTSAELNYHFIKRLSKFPIKAQNYIVWYENQIRDKGLLLGLQRFMPHLNIIGHQCLFKFDDPLRMHCFPNPNDILLKIYPTRLYQINSMVIQDHYKNIFKKHLKSIKKAPAFRFNQIYQFKPKYPEQHLNFTILVGLSLEENIAINLLNTFRDLFNKESLKYLRFIFRLHPTHDFKKYNSIIRNLFSKSTFTIDQTSNLHELINESHIFVSNISATIYEALGLGKPAVIFDPLSEATKPLHQSMLNYCNDIEDLAQVIESIRKNYNENINRYKQETDNIRNQYFWNPTDEIVIKLYNL